MAEVIWHCSFGGCWPIVLCLTLKVWNVFGIPPLCLQQPSFPEAALSDGDRYPVVHRTLTWRPCGVLAKSACRKARTALLTTLPPCYSHTVINPSKGIASRGETVRAQAKSKLKTGSKQQDGTRPDPARHEHQINQAAGVMGCFLSGPAWHNQWIPPFCFDGKCKNPTHTAVGKKRLRPLFGKLTSQKVQWAMETYIPVLVHF